MSRRHCASGFVFFNASMCVSVFMWAHFHCMLLLYNAFVSLLVLMHAESILRVRILSVVIRDRARSLSILYGTVCASYEKYMCADT